MKKLKKWPLFLAVLLILGSAALPYVVSQMQDAFTERKSETRTITAMRLPVGAEQRIGQILQMCAYQNLQMMWDGATNLTAPEVENSIKEAVAQMTQAGLLENVEVADGEAIAYLYVSEKDWQVSTIAWQYTWIDKEMRCYASVDDTTGKLLGILHGDYANGFDGSEAIKVTSMEGLEELAHKWAAFCEDYYGISTFTVSDLSQSEGSSWFTLAFTLGEEGETETCEIQVILQPDCIIFNM